MLQKLAEVGQEIRASRALKTQPGNLIPLILVFTALALNSSVVQTAYAASWVANGLLTTARQHHTATLLPNGNVLVAEAMAAAKFRKHFSVIGSQFRGVPEGWRGNSKGSSADYPLVQLRSIESGQATFLLSTNWSTNSFTSLPAWNFPPGYALATVFVDGMPGTSSIVSISVPVPAATTLTEAKN